MNPTRCLQARRLPGPDGWRRLNAPAGTLLVYGAGALAFLWAAVARRHGLEVLLAGRRPDRAFLAGLRDG